MGALEAHGSRYGKVGGWGHSGVTVVSCAGGRPFVQQAGNFWPCSVEWDTHTVYLLFAKAYKTRMGPEVVSLRVSSRVL